MPMIVGGGVRRITQDYLWECTYPSADEYVPNVGMALLCSSIASNYSGIQEGRFHNII